MWSRWTSATAAKYLSEKLLSIHSHTHTHTRLTALFPGLPGWAGTRKVKPIWILLKQETVSGNGISWAICKSAPRCRQITTPHCVNFAPGRAEKYCDDHVCVFVHKHISGTTHSIFTNFLHSLTMAMASSSSWFGIVWCGKCRFI